MFESCGSAGRLTLSFLLMFGAGSAATWAADLSMYRNFHLGTDLPTVAKQASADPSQAMVIHRRPALIQDLEWRPQPLGPSSQREAAQDVFFSFYDGELFRIVVNYDRYETEGLTADDFVDAISATYGPAAKPTVPKPIRGLAVPFAVLSGKLCLGNLPGKPVPQIVPPLCPYCGPRSDTVIQTHFWPFPSSAGNIR